MAQVSAEKLEHTGPSIKKRVALVPPRESSWQVRQSRLCRKEKNRAISPEHQIMRGERVKMSKSRTLAKVRGSKREQGEKRVDSTVKEYRF